MSDRLLLVTLLLLGAASPAGGQGLEQLERRVRILNARNELLLDSIKLDAERAFEQQPRVTIVGDGFAISAPDWAVARLARGLSENAPEWRELYGRTFDSLRNDTLVVWISDADTGVWSPTRQVEWRFVGASGGSRILIAPSSGYDPLSVFASEGVVAWERSLLDSSTTAWLGVPLTGSRGEGMKRAALTALLGSNAGPSQRCVAGRIADCERILDLDSPADSALRWYDAGDRAWTAAIWIVRNDVPGRAACVSVSSAEACYAFIRSQGLTMARPAGVNVVRQSFYRFVVESGGDGAIERFRTSPGHTVAEKLSAVAGRPVAELVPEWRAWLDRGRSDDQGGLALPIAIACGWMVVFSLLFAWRFRWIRV